MTTYELKNFARFMGLEIHFCPDFGFTSKFVRRAWENIFWELDRHDINESEVPWRSTNNIRTSTLQLCLGFLDPLFRILFLTPFSDIIFYDNLYFVQKSKLRSSVYDESLPCKALGKAAGKKGDFNKILRISRIIFSFSQWWGFIRFLLAKLKLIYAEKKIH